MLTLLFISMIHRVFGPKISRYIPEPSPKLMRTMLFIFTFIAVTFSKVFSQESETTFSLHRNSKMIGRIEAKLTKQDNGRIITTVTRVKARVVFTVHFNENKTINFKGSVLQSAELTRDVSSMMKKHRSIKKSGSFYLVSADGKSSRFTKEITHTISDLYFTEPKNIRMVYSEFWQQMIMVRKVDENSYLTDYPDGSSTTFIYQGGECTGFETNTKYGLITGEKEQKPLAKADKNGWKK